jgi:protein-tyrosine phosphatase
MTGDEANYRLAVVGSGRVRGQIAMAGCPGRTGAAITPALSGWRLQRDVATLKHWGAQALITLLDKAEFAWLRLAELPGLLSVQGIDWVHLPLRPDTLPDERFDGQWRAVAPRLRSILWCGGRVAVHCLDGRSRTALISARLLVELGCPTQDAINRVRGARPGVLQAGEEQQFLSRQHAAPEAAYRTRLSLIGPIGQGRAAHPDDATMQMWAMPLESAGEQGLQEG